MAPPTPGQQRMRHRVERLIAMMAPGLDLLLAAGDRLSRLVDRDEAEYQPPRVTRGRIDTLPPR